MDKFKYIKVRNYFFKKISKVYCKNVYVSYPSHMSLIKGYGKLIPFNIGFMKKKLKYKGWVKQSLGVCYEHSSSILLGLNMQDKCVIGKCDYNNNANFYHAWNEFMYNGEWFVFDCGDNHIYEKDKYYKTVNPTIIESWTLQEVLEKYKENKKIGKKMNFIIPNNYVEENPEKIQVPRQSLTQHSLYKDTKIKLNKKGEIVSAEVPGHEIG